MKRNYGWRPDLPDARDKNFFYRETATLPASVDLRPGCSPIMDQGDLGSCVGHAWAGLMEFLQMKQNHDPGKGPEEYTDGRFEKVSRLALYYFARAVEGTTSEDAGAYLRDGAKGLFQFGAPREKLWPYIIRKFAQKPTATAMKEAAAHKISIYRRLRSHTARKSCLASGFPFVFGFSVYESFESDQVASSGVVPMPKESEEILGGHAVMAVGYNEKRRAYLIRNSWGMDWALRGYFWLPYEYVNNADLADDFWTAVQ